MKQDTNTHTNAPKDRCDQLKAEIIALLKWNEQGYSDLQYHRGLRYLNLYLDGDEHYETILSQSKIFWSWWRNHWANRDEQFISMMKQVYIHRLDISRKMYTQYHRADELAACIHPNSVVLNETYVDMVTEVVKIETTR